MRCRRSRWPSPRVSSCISIATATASSPARPESVTWLLAGDVLRREAGGGAQPVINAVRALTFTYVDADNRATTDPATVRRVAITLATRPDHTRTVATQSLGATLTTDVALRNP